MKSQQINYDAVRAKLAREQALAEANRLEQIEDQKHGKGKGRTARKEKAFAQKYRIKF